MAYEVVLRPAQSRAKVRNPWGVLGLSLVTLGFYSLFWWYFINRELRDFGRAQNAWGLGTDPGISCLAYALGCLAFYIPWVWTIVTTTKRVRRAQALASRDDPMNPWLVGVIWVLTLGLGGLVLTQNELNKVWQSDLVEQAQVPGAVSGEASAALSPAPSTAPDQLERLEKLAALRDSGALTDEEYEVQKARILETL